MRRLWPEEYDDPPSPRPPVVIPGPRPPFRYNGLHDLESLWWVAVYFIYKRRVVDETQDGPQEGDTTNLVEQYKNYLRIFKYEDQRYWVMTGPGLNGDYRLGLHPAVHPIVDILEGVRQDLVSVYTEKEDNLEGNDLHPYIHMGLADSLLRVAEAGFHHIKLVPLPKFELHGQVFVPKASAPVATHQGTKHSVHGRAEDEAGEETQPAKRARTSRNNKPPLPNRGRTRPYLPRKAKPLRNLAV